MIYLLNKTNKNWNLLSGVPLIDSKSDNAAYYANIAYIISYIMSQLPPI